MSYSTDRIRGEVGVDGDRLKLGNFAWPGLLAVIVSLYAYWTSERQLDSARPEAVAAPPWGFVTTGELSAVHARLWDDPLQVSYEDWKSRKEQDKSPPTDPAISIEFLPAPTGEQGENRSNSVLPACEHFRSLVTTYPADTWARHLKSGLDGFPTVVLPVLMRGGSSPEQSDWRRRQQYAVLSGLARCGFKLDFPDRMSYFVIRNFNQSVIARPDLTTDDTRPFDLVVPVKLVTVDDSRVTDTTKDSAEKAAGIGSIQLRPDEETRRRCQVLVLYVNESQLGAHPLDALGSILNEMFGEYRPMDEVWRRLYVRILGPTTSDPLQAYLKPPSDESPFCQMLRAGEDYRIRVYSAHATVRMAPEAAHHRSDAVQQTPGEVPTADSPPRVPLIRVMGDDRQLVNAIHHELHVRHVCPHGAEDGHELHDAHGEYHHPAPGQDDAHQSDSEIDPGTRPRIALITEQDSSYGREIVKLFEARFGKDTVLTFRYFRGIDGRTGQPGKSTHEPKAADSVSMRGRNDPFTALPRNAEWSWRPEGASQYDYLLRLRESLQSRDWELRHTAGGVGIRAIGVVATDVYDKLLVLRALRSSFPEAVFFTTDLDANLSHLDEYPSTRNMLVASHFGLQLHSSLQRDIPPFRESYQTSTFLATLLALNLPEAESRLNTIDPWHLNKETSEAPPPITPLVFEIGRQGPYQLTLGADQFLRYDADHDRRLSDAELSAMPHAGGEQSATSADQNSSRDRPLTPRELLKLPARADAALLHPVSRRERAFPLSEFCWLIAAIGLLATLVVFASTRKSERVQGTRFPTASAEGRTPRLDASQDSPKGAIRSAERRFWASLGLAGGAVVLLGIVVSGLLTITATSPDFEPFDFMNGVSSWPIILLNLTAIIFCVWTLLAWKRRENGEDRKFEKTLEVVGLDSDAVPGVERPARFASVLNWAVLYVLCGMLAVFGVNGWTWNPGYTRGSVAYLEAVSRFGAQFASATLVVAVVIYHEKCRQFLSKLWKQFDSKHERYVIAISLIVDRTEIVGRRMLRAFVVLLLICLSFHPCLDFNPVPAGVLIGGCLGFAAVLAWSILVRQQADKFRRKAVQSLKARVLQFQQVVDTQHQHWSHNSRSADLLAADSWDDEWESPERGSPVKVSPSSSTVLVRSAVDADADVKRIQAEIDYLEAVNRGAYRPWLSSPATAWLTGSAGAWLGFDWICNWLQTGM